MNFITRACLVGTLFFVIPLATFAQESPSNRMFKSVETVSAGYGQTVNTGALPLIIGNYINVFIEALSVVLLAYLLYGGYLWMTAQGEDKQVDKARSVIKNAIIGMVVVSLSFAISAFVIGQIAASQAGTETSSAVGP